MARSRGFALLEVLIAFVIAALALGALARSGMGSLLALDAAGRQEEALARARSRLAVALHGTPLVAGEQQGDDGGGFRWRVVVIPAAGGLVTPLGSRGARRQQRVQTMLYAVSVQVWWAGGGGVPGARREVRLDTQHVESVLR